jgi:hypothetical protein
VDEWMERRSERWRLSRCWVEISNSSFPVVDVVVIVVGANEWIEVCVRLYAYVKRA